MKVWVLMVKQINVNEKSVRVTVILVTQFGGIAEDTLRLLESSAKKQKIVGIEYWLEMHELI